jgi:hypothetical protein
LQKRAKAAQRGSAKSKNYILWYNDYVLHHAAARGQEVITDFTYCRARFYVTSPVGTSKFFSPHGFLNRCFLDFIANSRRATELTASPFFLLSMGNTR